MELGFERRRLDRIWTVAAVESCRRLPRPSRGDIAFTQRLRRLSNERDVPLLDQFILAENGLVHIGD
jgi:hypothetical protein